MTTTLSSKGQVVIPSQLRKALALREGAEFECELKDGKIVLDPSSSQTNAILHRENGRTVLEAPEGAPKMTPELVRDLLHS